MARPKENEREDIRALVLSTAKKLFLEEGYHKITMRRIARDIGYTPGTIYLYFKNKDEILYELHNEGFQLLYQYKMRLAAGGTTSGALDRLLQGGKMYIDFALDHPDYYEVMFNMPEPKNFMEEQRKNTDARAKYAGDYAMRSYEFLKQSIQNCMDEGYLQGVDSDMAAFLFWATVHGLVALIIRKRIPYPQTPTRELAYTAVELFMRLVTSERFASETYERLTVLKGNG